MTAITYNIAKEHFGTEDRKSTSTKATEEEREPIKDLNSGLRDRLCRLRNAQFIKDSYRFTKALLGEASSGTVALAVKTRLRNSSGQGPGPG